MEWRLLNQHCVTLESEDYNVVVLEELISSDLQLAQLLVSGMVSMKTMLCLLSRENHLTSIKNHRWLLA